MCVVADDCALPRDKGITGRRGVAGTVLVAKVAGAAAEAGLSLDEVSFSYIHALGTVDDSCVFFWAAARAQATSKMPAWVLAVSSEARPFCQLSSLGHCLVENGKLPSLPRALVGGTTVVSAPKDNKTFVSVPFAAAPIAGWFGARGSVGVLFLRLPLPPATPAA